MGRYAERKQEQTTRTKQKHNAHKTQQNKMKRNETKQNKTKTYEALAKLCLVVTDEKGQPASKPASQQASQPASQPASKLASQQLAGGRRQGRSLYISAAARSNLRANAGVQDSRCSGPTTHSSDS